MMYWMFWLFVLWQLLGITDVCYTWYILIAVTSKKKKKLLNSCRILIGNFTSKVHLVVAFQLMQLFFAEARKDLGKNAIDKEVVKKVSHIFFFMMNINVFITNCFFGLFPFHEELLATISSFHSCWFTSPSLVYRMIYCIRLLHLFYFLLCFSFLNISVIEKLDNFWQFYFLD